MGELGKIKCLRRTASLTRVDEIGRWAAPLRAALFAVLATMISVACRTNDPTPGRAATVVVENPYGDAGRGVFYESKAALVQPIDLGESRRVIIECYCSKRRITTLAANQGAYVKLRGIYAISGYHGSPEDAGATPIRSEQLRFSPKRTGAELTLSSPEWAYLHHSMHITSIDVHVPAGVIVTFNVLTHANLEGRQPE